MNARNIALTGVPRAGTTLACRLLGQCRDAVALFEPMAVLALPRAHDLALAQVLAFFADVRARVARDRTAPRKVSGGAVPDNLYCATGSPGTLPLQATPRALYIHATPTKHSNQVN